jgi:hypothetical protein
VKAASYSAGYLHNLKSAKKWSVWILCWLENYMMA